MPILWRPVMAIDNDAVDHDHQVLISVINEFSTGASAADEFGRMLELLDRLEKYTQIHFAREEKLQIAVRYPYHEAHHQEHQDLIRQLGEIRAVIETAAAAAPESENTEDDLRRLRAKVDALLHDWLVDHVVKSDLRMKPYAKAMAPYVRALEPMPRGATSRSR